MNTSSASQTRQLTALHIPSIDLTGNGGLGWNDLKDPLKGVALFAVTPPGTENGDQIELIWNGKVVHSFLVHTVRPTLDFSVLPQDIPDEPEISEVFYRITPAAGGADDSPPRRVRVKRSVPGGPDTDYQTPWVNENLAPVQNLPAVIDTLTDLTLTVPVWPDMQEGDVLRVFWGSSEFVVENPPLQPGEEGRPQSLIVTAQVIDAAGNAEHLIVNYEIRDAVNNWSLYSLPALTSVDIRLADLPAPTVEEASGGVLDPLAGVAGVTAVVAYPGMWSGDEITLRWAGHEVETFPPSQPGSPTGIVRFTVFPDDIAPVIGKTTTVTYVVVRGEATLESDAHSLTVRPLPASSLPTPKIAQAQYPERTLDVTLLEGDADLTLGVWPFIAVGQRLWLRFEGTAHDGSAYEWLHPAWQNFPITSDTAQHTQVGLNELEKLKRDSSLRLIAEVSFDGGHTRTPFPVDTLRVVTLHPGSGSEDWENHALSELPLDQEVPCARGSSIRLLRGAAVFVNLGTSHPGFGKRTLKLDYSNHEFAEIRYCFGSVISALSFDLSYIGPSTDVNYVSFHDAEDVEIERENLPTGSYTYQKTLSRPCLYWRFVQNSATTQPLIDNVVWTGWSP